MHCTPREGVCVLNNTVNGELPWQQQVASKSDFFVWEISEGFCAFPQVKGIQNTGFGPETMHPGRQGPEV